MGCFLPALARLRRPYFTEPIDAAERGVLHSITTRAQAHGIGQFPRHACAGLVPVNTRTASANRVTWVGFWANLLMTILKLAAGIAGHSGAMVADAVHSLSDFATDLVVLASFRVVGKPADRNHKYGHGKYETLATAVVGVVLLAAGIGIFWGGATSVWASVRGQPLARPAGIAFAAAIASIVIKEWLYRYTARVGERIHSQAVLANAWHHRSDALSSVAAAMGIGGAILFGEPWRILDPLAAMIVSFFIVKVALKIASGSVRELSEESLDEVTESEIVRIASSYPGATDVHNLRTRRIGSDIAIDLHICMPPDTYLADAHAIASKIESDLRERFGQSTYVSIHMEPHAT